VTIQICREGDSLAVLWQEQGGPRVAGAPERRGFGSQMMARSVGTQLGGELKYEWQPEGLTIRITAPIERLGE
jgi:two-component sensor histidine kinase